MKPKIWAISFTREEAIEMIRAIELIGQEDACCNVNMDDRSVRAKKSSLKKLERAFDLRGPVTRMDKLMRTAKSIGVKDVK